ncbi:MAG: hypothetical protein EZS26_002995 [Candidatus Ordinivivax streblomastigis]|uniref:Uncharacterized protein n=1 Tax=Candidatus Ordinivivax streblomastigis TaxID=2540710 RepID=A0A5M8NWR8_9BACT|nr:MAG: hypothetical protein EZS26_002995 [Candidatus Ordinivivax streblomastigis]
MPINAMIQHTAGNKLIIKRSPNRVSALCCAIPGLYLNQNNTQPVRAAPNAQPSFCDIEDEENIKPDVRRLVFNSWSSTMSANMLQNKGKTYPAHNEINTCNSNIQFN